VGDTPRASETKASPEEATTSLASKELSNLAALLRCGPEIAKSQILHLKKQADVCKRQIEEEMMLRYGFKWDIWMGFHAVPSMEYAFCLGVCPWKVPDRKPSPDIFICMSSQEISYRRR
jgi:hypothetical protein